jgi:hypothetical protein
MATRRILAMGLAGSRGTGCIHLRHGMPGWRYCLHTVAGSRTSCSGISSILGSGRPVVECDSHTA